MSIKNGLNRFNSAVCGYYHNSLNYVGTTAVEWKDLRNNINFFQKISISQLGCIDFFNAYRGTNLLGELASRLNATYLTDFPGFIKVIHAWFKPINAYSVHDNALLEKLVSAYAAGFDKDYSGEDLKNDLRDTLKEYLIDLTTIKGKGYQFGFATSREFLTNLRDHIDAKSGPEFAGYRMDLATRVGEVPLREISWVQLLIKDTFIYVDAMTIVYYFKEWGFLDTAKWAASIGQVRGFGWVNNIDFYTSFKFTMLFAYTGLLIDAGSRVYQAYGRTSDSSLGPAAKHNAPWDAVTAAAECVFYTIGVLSSLEVINDDPVLIALSLVAAKTIGCFSCAAKKSEMFDTPAQYGVAKPSLFSRFSDNVSDRLSSVTQQRHVALAIEKLSTLAKKVMSTVSSIFDYLVVLIDLENDGFDKGLKSLIPKTSIADQSLEYYGKEAVFEECRTSLEWFKDAIYATKIFSSIPRWLVINPHTKDVELRCPLYEWNKGLGENGEFELKWKEPERWSTTFGDIANALDTSKFIHKNIYPLEYCAGIGKIIYESHIPVFGAVKNIPVLEQVYSTNVKNIPTFIGATIDIGAQLYRLFINRDWNQFNWENRFKLAGNIGKLVLIWWNEPSFWFDVAASFTGDAGLIKYWIGVGKAKAKFNHPNDRTVTV